MTGRPTYGVLPYADELWLDAEDSLSVVARRVIGTPTPPRGKQWLRVAAIRLPRISNSTDVEALACESGVLVRWVADPPTSPTPTWSSSLAAKPPSPTCRGCAIAVWPTRSRRTPVPASRCWESVEDFRCCAVA